MPQHPDGHVFYRNMARAYPVIDHGEGVTLYDADGRRYLDASGGPLVVNIGHGVRSVAEAMAAQAAQVAYVHGERFTTAALEAYSRRLAARVPLPDPRFYYLSGGAEAVEAAVKFARQLQVARGEAARDLVISRWGSYHGATLGTLALSGKLSMRALFAPMFRDAPHVEPPYCYRCPLGEVARPVMTRSDSDQAGPERADGDCFASLRHTTPHCTTVAMTGDCGLLCAHRLEAEILRQGPDHVAAFIAEPVGGATLGAIVPPPGYWPLIRDICDRHGVLLIADEVLTGFGRTGTWFAVDQLGVRPDLMVMAKGAAGGYFPLSILAARGADVETIRLAHGNFNHGGTFSHHAVGAAAALATIDYLETHDLIARAATLGAALGRKLREALGDLPSVGDVRGIGMVWAVEFVADRQSKAPYPAGAHFADRVCARAMDLGVLFYPGHGSVDGVQGDHLMIAPPYVVTEEEVDTIVQVLRQAILDSDPKG